ncbi:hypothetical protein ACJX0J_036262, partial [Zea mays]
MTNTPIIDFVYSGTRHIKQVLKYFLILHRDNMEEHNLLTSIIKVIKFTIFKNIYVSIMLGPTPRGFISLHVFDNRLVLTMYNLSKAVHEVT